MNALNLLKEDHQKVAELLEQGMQTKQAEQRLQILEKLEQLLKPHEQIEEKLFYPELKKKAGDEAHHQEKEKVAEAYQEHHIVDVLLAELKKLSPAGETWLAKFTVLKENIEHHVQEEEGVMFKQAREVFSKEQLEEYGNKMQEMKEAIN